MIDSAFQKLPLCLWKPAYVWFSFLKTAPLHLPPDHICPPWPICPLAHLTLRPNGIFAHLDIHSLGIFLLGPLDFLSLFEIRAPNDILKSVSIAKIFNYTIKNCWLWRPFTTCCPHLPNLRFGGYFFKIFWIFTWCTSDNPHFELYWTIWISFTSFKMKMCNFTSKGCQLWPLGTWA